MKTFIIRARKGTTRWDRIMSGIGSEEHIEVVAHTVMNAFFVSNGFREDVDVYIVLDSSEDFPRSIHLSGNKGLSIDGFHEAAILKLIENALKESTSIGKDGMRIVAMGVTVYGFGFEKLLGKLLETRPVYLLDRKGGDIRDENLHANPVFVLSDHLAMPKNIMTSLKRRGARSISLGKKMLFASQCVVLIHDELDRAVF